MKFSAITCRLLAFASFALVTPVSLFGAQPAAATPHAATTTTPDANPTPASATPLTDSILSMENGAPQNFHVFKIVPGKMEDALKSMRQRINDPARPSVVAIDGDYLILLLDKERDTRDTVEKLLSPYLDNGPELAPFTLEIRHGSIFENDKEIGPATVGSVMDYIRKKNPDFSILCSGVADVPVGDLYLHTPEFNPDSVCHAIAKSTDGLVFDDGVDSGGVRSLTLAPTESLDRDVAVFNLTLYVNPDGKADSKAIHEKYESVVEVILQTLNDLNPNAGRNAEPKFEFHEGANLLVVTGSRQALEVAGKVVYGLLHLDAQPGNANASSSLITPTPSGDHVIVTGQVNKVGAIPLPTNSHMTVSEAILAAGNFTQWANHIVDLNRKEKDPDGKEVQHTFKVNVDDVLSKDQTDKDIPLMPGDVIVVEQSWVSQL